MDYKFIVESNAGAALILPFGATLHGLPHDKSKSYLRSFQDAATKHGHHWCACSQQQNLYLVTGMYKARDFILTSFDHGRSGEEMFVKSVGGKDHELISPRSAASRVRIALEGLENQTVLIKGFRITLRWNCVPEVEQLLRLQPRIISWITSLSRRLKALLKLASMRLSQTSELFYNVTLRF